MVLAAGKYRIQVSKPGWDTAAQWVSLAAGEALDVEIALNRKEAATGLRKAPRKGSLWQDPKTGMEFLWVPGGCYQMGCGTGTKDCDDAEKPAHKVCVDAFWMGRYEVTQGQWQKVMAENPSHFVKGDKYPVEQVSWKDAKAFIEKVEHMHNGRYRFRLPTEAEWEYACRNMGEPENSTGGPDVSRMAWHRFNSSGMTHPVGTRADNGLGLYDMKGNVWEWCEDNYDPHAYQHHKKNNPRYYKEGAGRVWRGGSWISTEDDVRCTARQSQPGYRFSSLGFRLVRTE